MNFRAIDKPTFGIATAVCVISAALMLVMPDRSAQFLDTAYQWIADHFGLSYIVAAIALLVFLLWLAFSRHGRIRLGEEGDKPEFSSASWMGMLFSAGVGASIIFWGTTEWGFYIEQPPFGDRPWSPDGVDQAMTYGMFHWGLAAWAFYALPTVAIAYAFYVKRVPHLRLGMACKDLLGERFDDSFMARVMDALFIIALIAGAGTSIGLAISLISGSLDEIAGIGRSLTIDITVIAGCILLFMASSFRGLKRGIRWLSDFNMVLAFLFLLFVLFAGPTLFILSESVYQAGYMARSFVKMITWTGSEANPDFVKDWTIFYWAWWLAYAPFIGLFVTRISRGRTIRQVIMGMLLLGSLGAWVFYMVLGNYALWLEMEGVAPMVDMITGGDQAGAIITLVKQLPLADIVLVVVAILSIVFIATSFDSASFTLASAATKTLHADEEPNRWHRMYWCVALGSMPMAVLFTEGGMVAMKSLVLIASLPMLVVFLIMALSLVKSLYGESRE